MEVVVAAVVVIAMLLLLLLVVVVVVVVPILVAPRSKTWVCGLSVTGIVGLNPARDMDVCLSVVSIVCGQVEVCASALSLVQRSPTGCVVSERDREASIVRTPCPTRDWSASGKKVIVTVVVVVVVVISPHVIPRLSPALGTRFFIRRS